MLSSVMIGSKPAIIMFWNRTAWGNTVATVFSAPLDWVEFR